MPTLNAPPITRLAPLWSFFKRITRSFIDRRISLWIALVGLVVALLVTLVWLAGRYEASQYQAELDRDAADAVSDIRGSFSRHVLYLQGLQAKGLAQKSWQTEAGNLLAQNRDWLRVEQRDLQANMLAFADSPLREPVFNARSRMSEQVEILQTCLRAKRLNGPVYSKSYFVPQKNGLGLEVMEVCIPAMENGFLMGYTLLTYGLQDILVTQLGETYGRRNEISFTEPDGTRP